MVLPAATSFAVLAADQATKGLVISLLPQNAPFRLVPGLFEIIHARNPHAAMGWLAGMGGLERAAFFFALPLLVIAVMIQALRRGMAGPGLWGVMILAGGAAGNILDRGFRGHVIDFVGVYWQGALVFVFNLADVAICLGLGILACDLLRSITLKR